MKTKYVYGDNIDTDRIIPGKYTKTLDMSTLAQHCMEDLDPSFATTIIKGDIVVAGDNFGCGSVVNKLRWHFFSQEFLW